MVRRNRFPPEADTRPDLQKVKGPGAAPPRQSGPAPKEARRKSDAPPSPRPTLPPPTKRSGRPSPKRGRRVNVSDVREIRGTAGGATVDEVTADLSKDPRRERDDED